MSICEAVLDIRSVHGGPEAPLGSGLHPESNESGDWGEDSWVPPVGNEAGLPVWVSEIASGHILTSNNNIGNFLDDLISSLIKVVEEALESGDITDASSGGEAANTDLIIGDRVVKYPGIQTVGDIVSIVEWTSKVVGIRARRQLVNTEVAPVAVSSESSINEELRLGNVDCFGMNLVLQGNLEADVSVWNGITCSWEIARSVSCVTGNGGAIEFFDFRLPGGVAGCWCVDEWEMWVHQNVDVAGVQPGSASLYLLTLNSPCFQIFSSEDF